ncbi:MAG: phosphoserine phosphatase [Candidatus Lambdaproteobacteria bacterium RIFOXYD1_FULL_56_27]|uniref:phosphoserine phosphatase n=1 Tax=Candidatus Lambdaproteobacteria bacterium RIFOXYD2_FULL_56_26 TaxID=1817773 RepID=A0A1F6GRL6_9PROT|nr:MAG: phosphoserine phosphatase [Candidatus Lambdaproteobacteria bacterium RIFOXYC1_FULL_56_13]OGH00720.1 MAG: phosphoserine phosphatase [Candidatus Lambdaproteobacteria bacterium RIFOXYD2_FULL_56_26]OGH07887.1 MAG: phosphoserine phosphatase [Candidatus Lambdaproteobacteria bacterium RIFOXYD1_FULL_56_27]
MFVTCLDLEGVLVPEVWINVAKKTGIEELKLTTRDITDYDKLMGIRLGVIEKHGLTLKDIQGVIATLDPFEGALEFLDWLKERSQVVILSDTFIEFAKPLMTKLGMPTIFCHSLSLDGQGKIANYHLRIKDPKRKAVQAFKNLNFKTVAAGDSFNDLSMLEEAHQGIFFRPPAAIAAQYPQYPVVQDYNAFRQELLKVLPEPY